MIVWIHWYVIPIAIILSIIIGFIIIGLIKVKYGIGFVLYTLGLFWLSTINPKIFLSVGVLSIGMLFLVEAYHTEEKHD